MKVFDVFVEKYTMGTLRVEAKDADDARFLVAAMYTSDIEDAADWGSCGDYVQLADDYPEEVHMPSVGDRLWA